MIYSMSKIISFGKSDPGLRRSNNEDAFLVHPELGFLALADGMGGAAAGEVASRLFTETAFEVFSKTGGESEGDTASWVQDTFQKANQRMLNHVKENPVHRGMGCTAELLAFGDRYYVLGHVGDSRTYLFRNGQLRQLTRDHSFIQDQIDQGLMTAAEAKNHPFRNVILRAVGAEETLAVDLTRGKTLAGDVFLLCSDGLSNMVDDLLIQEWLLSPLGLSEKVERLIQLAKAAGGYDNITVVLCEVVA
jgi:PPM family protein phosphatase